MFHLFDALRYYRSYRIRSILLNQLLIEKEIPFDKIGVRVAQKLDDALLWKTFVNDMSPEAIFLIETGLAGLDKKKGVIFLTEEGIASLRNGTFDGAANAAFRNFVNIRLQVTAIIISAILLIINTLAILFR